MNMNYGTRVLTKVDVSHPANKSFKTRNKIGAWGLKRETRNVLFDIGFSRFPIKMTFNGYCVKLLSVGTDNRAQFEILSKTKSGK